MVLMVKEVAEARGFKNAKQLADNAGIRYKSMYPIWNGTARMIGLDTLEKLCDTLRVQAGMLFEKLPDSEVESVSDAETTRVKAKMAKAGKMKVR